jgi:hypothetical protein
MYAALLAFRGTAAFDGRRVYVAIFAFSGPGLQPPGGPAGLSPCTPASSRRGPDGPSGAAVAPFPAGHAIPQAPGGEEEAPERQRTLFSWAEFMAGEPDEPPKPRRRDEAPTLSPFEWALERE